MLIRFQKNEFNGYARLQCLLEHQIILYNYKKYISSLFLNKKPVSTTDY